MKKKVSLLVLALAFVVILGGASTLYDDLSGGVAPSSVTVREDTEMGNTSYNPRLAPDFTVKDMKGNMVSLSDMVGKPVVVNFWASWCGPCKREMPAFQEKFAEYGDEIQFMMVNMTGGRETARKAKKFVKKAGYTFPVYFDTQQSAAIAYGVSSIPATYFINEKGEGVVYGLGALSGDVLQQGIDMLLATED